jgi:hypothetical protein
MSNRRIIVAANPKKCARSRQSTALVHEPQERLLYERGGLQGGARPLGPQPRPRDATELGIHRREQAIGRLRITAPPRLQQAGHVPILRFLCHGERKV